MSENVHVSESGGAYALGALTRDEAQEVEAHMAACDECRQEVAQLRGVVSLLPLACSSQEPPPSLRARVLAATKGEDQAHAILQRVLTGAQGGEGKRDFWHRPFPSWAGVAGWLGLAAACVTAGIFIGIADEHSRMMTASAPPVTLAHNETLYNVYPVSADQLERAVNLIGESQVWDLSVSKTGQRIPCKVIQPRNVAHAMLVSSMPATRDGMVYEVWLVRRGKIHRAGIVKPGPMVQTTIPMRVQSGDMIAFSMEPAGGSARPTSPFLMQQTL